MRHSYIIYSKLDASSLSLYFAQFLFLCTERKVDKNNTDIYIMSAIHGYKIKYRH